MSDAADFSGFTTDPRGLRVDEVLHRTYVDVDENGTEAAATVMLMALAYGLLGVKTGNRRKLLKALAERFPENDCYSRIRDFLGEHDISYESFRWT